MNAMWWYLSFSSIAWDNGLDYLAIRFQRYIRANGEKVRLAFSTTSAYDYGNGNNLSGADSYSSAALNLV